jgi:HK97 family phage major capsid protein
MDSGLTSGNEILVYGDFRYYLIVDRVGMSVEVVPHLFHTATNYPSGQRGLLAFWRNTGRVRSAAAFRTLRTK